MKFLKMAALTGLVIAAVVVLALEPASGASTESNVADCSKAIRGSGAPAWSPEKTSGGPVSVSRVAMAKMYLGPNGTFYGKVPLMVEGEQAVTVSVPAALRGRVFLYYGHIVGRDGKPTTSFFAARGYGETEFQPCANRPRTIWPGGLRIKGGAPVHLLIHVGGDAEAVPLRLGRPRAYQPRS
jgi:hypothetical protein